MEQLIRSVVGTLMAAYFAGMTLAIPYFNWTYARDHGLVAWLFLGEVFATLKGVAWPIALYDEFYGEPSPEELGWTDEMRENAQHFVRVAELEERRSELLKKHPGKGIAAEDWPEIMRLTREELKHAELVRNEILEKILVGMSGPFRQKFQQSLVLDLKVEETRNMEDAIESRRLHDEWVDWINARNSELRIPKPKRSGLFD